MVPARNKQKSEHALVRAKFKCEIGNHETFLRKKNLLPYTEPHHLIPLQYDNQFVYSLDVEANIVSLCSNCHNKIHYGADIEQMLRQLWEQRREELEAAGLMEMKSGIRLTVDILLSFYGIK
jgi:predicted HNH restriction endonuclease